MRKRDVDCKRIRERIVALLEKEPWLTNYTISQRFGCPVDYVGDVRRSAGKKSPRTETLTDTDFKKSRFSKLIKKLRNNPHYITERKK
ncbi:MAG: hypothetical protein WC444_05045 [Candidatus Paceibacterota bacterium]